jgi:LAO/AO transport system kinase
MNGGVLSGFGGDAVEDVARRFADGDRAALARSISLVERRDPCAPALLRAIGATSAPPISRVGLTGAPGVGKSTLVDALIRSARAAGRSVGVLAVDPSSPFSGGALLGDRVRMGEHVMDTAVFVRSMSARGRVGGLAPAAAEVVWLLGAFGFDEVLVETVGAGQSELEVRNLVDTTVVVVTPGTGDDIQLDKSGILEIADIFVVNKADLPGADRLVRELRTMLNLGAPAAWRPPIVPTVATHPDEAVDQLWAAIAGHRAHLAAEVDTSELETERARRSMAALVGSRAEQWALDRARLGSPHDPELRAGLSIAVAEQLCAELGLNGAHTTTGGNPDDHH